MTKNYFFILLSLGVGLNSCGQKIKDQTMHKHTNSLIDETSPYLLQHAHNPVDWHAWNDDNLAEAKELDKPLLISIGYSSCHWCHVMEHESFENEEIAKYMNEHFYCIKVDREERPDVDQIYMTAASIIKGGGGWPLNCFALPNAMPFHAGTYFPAKGWQRLMESVDLQFKNNRPELEKYAANITRGIQMQETVISDNPSQKLDSVILVDLVEGWKSSWDMAEGGMNRAPKFPLPSNYDFLMDYTHHFKDNYTDKFINLTLEKMAYGGIFDQIGGGFSRYSTDAVWKAPHFEKMLYDNAQLLTIYSKAYKKYKNPLYLDVINKTIVWLEREMLDKSGLFYSALDADSEGEEGKFYVWTSKEAMSILGSDYELASEYYQIDKKGKWEHENNILLRNKSDSKIAKKFDISESELHSKILAINEELLSVRSKRIRPGLDDKCLTAWNGLIITGLSEAYKATGSQKYKTLATNCLNVIIKHQIRENTVLHSYKDGKSTINGMLDDFVFTAKACISVYEITGNEDYIEMANDLTKRAISQFYDTEKEIFYFNEENELIVRTTEVHDNVIPATNSAMADVLHNLGLIYGSPYYLTLSENIIGKVQKNMSSYPGGHSNWARIHQMHSMPYYEIAVVGKNAETVALELQQRDISNAIIVYATSKSDIPLLEGRLVRGETKIYVCQKGACQLPVTTVSEALNLLSQ